MKHRFLAQALLPCLAASIALLPAPKASYAQLAPAAKGVQLAAHRAVYELTLDHTGAGSNVSDIRGQLTYDFSGSECQGYTLNTRLVTEIFDRESKPSITDIRSEAQEDAEGKRFRFNTSQYVNDKLSENTKGLAVRSPRSRDIVNVELEKPKRGMLTLSGNVYFPTQHSLAILKAAATGQTRLQADIYDGSEKGTKIYETTTVIGAPLELAANAQLPVIKNSEALDFDPVLACRRELLRSKSQKGRPPGLRSFLSHVCEWRQPEAEARLWHILSERGAVGDRVFEDETLPVTTLSVQNARVVNLRPVEHRWVLPVAGHLDPAGYDRQQSQYSQGDESNDLEPSRLEFRTPGGEQRAPWILQHDLIR